MAEIKRTAPATHASKDEEAAVLGIYIYSEDKSRNPYDLTSEHFYFARFREIWNACREHYQENGRLPDLVEVFTRLCLGIDSKEKKDEWKRILQQDIADGYRNSKEEHYEDHLQRLDELLNRRKIEGLGGLLASGGIKLEEYLDQVKALEIRTKQTPPLSEQLVRFINRCSEKEQTKTILTGFDSFDTVTGGLQSTELVTIGGKTGKGKSALCCALALQMAKAGESVLFFSLEMSAFAILSRFMGSELNINTRSFRIGRLTDEEKVLVSKKASELSSLTVFIEDRRITYVRDIERIVKNCKPSVVFIDYIQRLFTGRGDNRAYELDYIVNRMKTMAIQQNCLVIIAAQLSRKADDMSAGATLENLSDSASLEKTSDFVLLLNPRDDDPLVSVIQVDVAKARHSSRCRFLLEFNKQYQNFREIQPRSGGQPKAKNQFTSQE